MSSVRDTKWGNWRSSLGWACYASIKAFWNCSRPLISITSSAELYCVIFLVSSSMVDVTSMCICHCGSSSTTSQSTSSLYHSKSGGVFSSGPSDQSSQIVYNATINANNTTSASASLSSSVCYCPCSPVTSTSYMSCKYACQAERNSSAAKLLGELKIFIWTFAVYTLKNSSNAESFFENLMQILFSYFAASQTIISILSQSMSPSSKESTAFRPSVPNQSDNISVGLSLTPTSALPMTITTSAITEVFSQGAFFASSSSSFVTQSPSSLMSESITFFA